MKTYYSLYYWTVYLYKQQRKQSNVGVPHCFNQKLSKERLSVQGETITGDNEKPFIQRTF